MNNKRLEEEQREREKFSDRWDKGNAVIIEYGNFCIKMLVTLNSTALLASVAFFGNFSSDSVDLYQTESLLRVLPHSFLSWSISLTLILLSAFFTYICHRWWPDLLSVWHKQLFPDLFKDVSFRERWSSKVYAGCVWMGIISGVISLLMFLCGIWMIAVSIL